MCRRRASGSVGHIDEPVGFWGEFAAAAHISDQRGSVGGRLYSDSDLERLVRADVRLGARLAESEVSVGIIIIASIYRSDDDKLLLVAHDRARPAWD